MLRAILLAIVALATLASTHPARALPSIDAARASCIAKVRPQVIACVRGHMFAYGGPPWLYRAACREPALPLVRTCVFRTLRDAGHPLLVGRPLPGPNAVCPLGFEGCMSRCNWIGGFGPAPATKGCGRICASRCGHVRAEAGAAEGAVEDTAPRAENPALAEMQAGPADGSDGY